MARDKNRIEGVWADVFALCRLQDEDVDSAAVRGESARAKIGEVVLLGCLHLCQTEGGAVFLGRTEYECLPVLVEDISRFVWLEPARTCMTEIIARKLIKWCVLTSAPWVWVSDRAAHFKNR